MRIRLYLLTVLSYIALDYITRNSKLLINLHYFLFIEIKNVIHNAILKTPACEMHRTTQVQ